MLETIYVVFKNNYGYKDTIKAFKKEQGAKNYINYLTNVVDRTCTMLEQFEFIEQKELLDLDAEYTSLNEFRNDTILTKIEEETYLAWEDLLVDDIDRLELYEMSLRMIFLKSILLYHFDIDFEISISDIYYTSFSYESIQCL